MPFPISLSGSVDVPLASSGDEELLIAAIQQAITRETAGTVYRVDREIHFEGKHLSLWKQTILNAVSDGVVRCTPHPDYLRLDYRLEFLTFFLGAPAAMILGYLLIALISHVLMSGWILVCFFTAQFLYFYFKACDAFPRLLRRTAREASSLLPPGPPLDPIRAPAQ